MCVQIDPDTAVVQKTRDLNSLVWPTRMIDLIMKTKNVALSCCKFFREKLRKLLLKTKVLIHISKGKRKDAQDGFPESGKYLNFMFIQKLVV